jgi:benzoylformate decarboxylase
MAHPPCLSANWPELLLQPITRTSTGTLATSISRVREQLTGFDVVVVFGAPAFRHHAWTAGAYLPPGTQPVMITADPDQAARAPMGGAIVGDPAGAMDALLPVLKPANRETRSKSTQAIRTPQPVQR